MINASIRSKKRKVEICLPGNIADWLRKISRGKTKQCRVCFCALSKLAELVSGTWFTKQNIFHLKWEYTRKSIFQLAFTVLKTFFYEVYHQYLLFLTKMLWVKAAHNVLQISGIGLGRPQSAHSCRQCVFLGWPIFCLATHHYFVFFKNHRERGVRGPCSTLL